MYVLCAPDSFKGTFSAADVAAALAEGVRAAGAQPIELPLADGGEGTADVLAQALDATPVAAEVHDPLGRPITASWFRADTVAIVEMARASGLPLVDEHERDAVGASTAGTGELIANAVAAGCTAIYVTAGGSATTDGGNGAIAAIEAAGGLPSNVKLRVLTDVTTAFVDAAAIFAPQKGADSHTVDVLTERLNAFAQTLPRDPRGVARTGAGGGISGGLWAKYDAALESGIDAVLDLVHFDDKLTADDGEPVSLILTGEGRFDGQTPYGKVVAGVANRAGDLPVAVVAGSTGDGTQNAVTNLQLQTLVVASTRTEIVEAAEAITKSLLKHD